MIEPTRAVEGSADSTRLAADGVAAGDQPATAVQRAGNPNSMPSADRAGSPFREDWSPYLREGGPAYIPETNRSERRTPCRKTGLS